MAQKALPVPAPNKIERNALKVARTKASQHATRKRSPDFPQEPAHSEELYHEGREQQEQNAAEGSACPAYQAVDQDQIRWHRLRQNPCKLRNISYCTQCEHEQIHRDLPTQKEHRTQQNGVPE